MEDKNEYIYKGCKYIAGAIVTATAFVVFKEPLAIFLMLLFV